MKPQLFGVLCAFILLAACGTRQTPAPVVSLDWTPHTTKSNSYVVNKGDTLYSIAWRYDMDYRDLAKINALSAPYALGIGQKLALFSQKKQFVSKKSQTKPIKKTHQYNKKIVAKSKWIYPAKGRIIKSFSIKQGSKGIDIAGHGGERVIASNNGKVAYAGSGLPGYGNLIIIKHGDNYLSAYAYNKKNLVREGQQVKVGQVIAEMGHISNNKWGLHFEIRKAGRPINPLKILKKA